MIGDIIIGYNNRFSNVFSLTLDGGNKQLSSKDSVFSKEINQSTSPINYVLMIFNKVENFNVDELDLKEAELFIKRLFVQGDYKHFAEKLQLNRDDLKSILIEASLFLGKKNIQSLIALILKSEDDNREVLVSSSGTGMFFIINSQSVRVLNLESPPGNTLNNQGSLVKPQLFVGKIKKGDNLLLCSETLTSVIELHLIQRIVISSKNPEEACKRLLHSASEAERKVNFSVAVFNGTGKKRKLGIKRPSNNSLIFIIIPLFLLLIAFLIYIISFRTRETQLNNTPVDSFESLKLPSKIKGNNTIKPPNIDTQISAKKDVVQKPINDEKKSKKESDKTSADIKKKFPNVSFTITGSVVIISNWELIKQEILFINWEAGISYNEEFHKYTDFESIPNSVKITFKDHSSKFFRINR